MTHWKVFGLALMVCAVGGTFSAKAFTVAENGAAKLKIAVAQDAVAAEKYAAEELALYLGKITGAQFSVNAAAPGATIQLVYDPALGREEWSYQVRNGNLVIRGGRPRGVLYGVYEFLEHETGVRWFTEEAEFVPKKPTLSLPDNLTRSGKPAFFYRYIYLGLRSSTPRSAAFFARSRLNGYPTPEHSERYGFVENIGGGRSCHTCFELSQGLPDECFSISADGKRQKSVSAMGPGNVCWSNTQAQRHFAAKLKKRIADDRNSAAADQSPAPMMYDLSVNDDVSANSANCYCPECKKIAAKYGESGPFILFINAVAREVAQEYPDVVIISLAYGCAVKPPHDLKVEKNVLFRLGQLGAELVPHGRDSLRPLSHPNNQTFLQDIREWAKYTAQFGTWDYWVLYSEPFVTPFTAIPMLRENLAEYRKCGYGFMFAESEIYFGDYIDLRLQSFFEMRDYIASHLLLNPAADVEAMIREYMRGVYGAAAPSMEAFYRYLAKRQNEEPGNLGVIAPAKRQFLDAAFFAQATQLLDQAEKAVQNNPVLLARVRQERLIVNEAILHLRNTGFQVASFDALMRNLERDYTAAYQKFYPNLEERAKGLAQKLAKLNAVKNLPAIPPELAGRHIVECYWSVPETFKDRAIVPDEEACTKFAITPINCNNSADFHKHDVAFGFYDRNNKKAILSLSLTPAQVPQDEKYHWVRIGRFKPVAGLHMWLHWSWQCPAPVGDAYSAIAPDKLFDAYVHFKVTGKSYVRNSQKADGFFVDRVILAEYVDEKTTPTTDFGNPDTLESNRKPPVPKRFSGKKIVQDTTFYAAEDNGPYNRIADDSDAPTGFAASPKNAGNSADFHKKNPNFGVYDYMTKKVLFSTSDPQFAKDEKYHWFKVGTTELTEHCRLWLHWSWANYIPLEAAFKQGVPGKKYEIWVSYKVQGAAYVPGSTKPDGFMVDRLIVCEAVNP